MASARRHVGSTNERHMMLRTRCSPFFLTGGSTLACYTILSILIFAFPSSSFFLFPWTSKEVVKLGDVKGSNHAVSHAGGIKLESSIPPGPWAFKISVPKFNIWHFESYNPEMSGVTSSAPRAIINSRFIFVGPSATLLWLSTLSIHG